MESGIGLLVGTGGLEQERKLNATGLTTFLHFHSILQFGLISYNVSLEETNCVLCLFSLFHLRRYSNKTDTTSSYPYHLDVLLIKGKWHLQYKNIYFYFSLSGFLNFPCQFRVYNCLKLISSTLMIYGLNPYKKQFW